MNHSARSSPFARFLRCARGLTAMEFGLLAPVIILFMMTTVELGLIYTTSIILEGAAGAVSRIGKTNFTAANECGATREAYLKCEVRRISGGWLKPEHINTEMKWYSGIDKVGQPEPCRRPQGCTAETTNLSEFDDINGNGHWDADQGADGPGSGGRSVIYKITYNWPLFTPITRYFMGGPEQKDTFAVVATAVVRNEKF